MKNQARIISFANHKGGVGKTTTTASVGSILASKGYKVLCIDLDAQANLTTSLIGDEPNITIYQAMMGECKELPTIPISENLDICPASLQLAMADIQFASFISRELILSGLIDSVRDKYDFILVDCPPSLGLLTLNAFAASENIVIPLTAQVLPFKGLTMILKFVEMVKKRLNTKLNVSGVLITQWEKTNLSTTIEKGLREAKDIFTFQTKIRKNITVAEAPLEKKNIIDYAPKSNGAADYLAFTEEFIKKLGQNL